jgi:large subunit ribosomal protein L21
VEANSNYAVIATGGKQYRVSKGSKIKVEKLSAQPGESVKLDQVLLICQDGQVNIGTPAIAGASVEAKVLEQKKGEKKIIFHKKIRKGYKRKQGHRQAETVLEISSINN